MALELVGGAALGAAVRMLLKEVGDAKEQTTNFQQALTRLESTLKSVIPRVDEISQLNHKLKVPDEEMKELITILRNGQALVNKSSKIYSINFVRKGQYSKELLELDYSLLRYFQTILPLDHFRDTKKMLLMITELHMGRVGAKDEEDSSNPKEDESSQAPDEGESSKPKVDEYSEIQSFQDPEKKETVIPANTKTKTLKLIIRVEQKPSELDTWKFWLKGCTYIFDLKNRSYTNYEKRKLYQDKRTNDVRNCECKAKRHGYVMVSRIEKVKIGKTKFEQQMETSGKIGDHPNIVPPFGYCFYQSELFLFYDSFPNGRNLYTRLEVSIREPGEYSGSGSRRLNWRSILKISLGVARGISYLHSVKCVHGNLHSSNVLLNLDFDGYISDYGLLNFSSAAKKSDVHSFGIILLQMISNSKPSAKEELHEWIKRRVSIQFFESTFYIIDKHEHELQKIAMLCLEKDLDKMPKMDDVVKMIQKIQTSAQRIGGGKDEVESSKPKEDESSQEPDEGESSKPKEDESSQEPDEGESSKPKEDESSQESDEGESSKPKEDESSQEPDEEESSKPKEDESSQESNEGESSKPKVDEYSEIQSYQDPEKKETVKLFEKMVRELDMGLVGSKDEGESSKPKEDESSQEPDEGESSKPKVAEYSEIQSCQHPEKKEIVYPANKLEWVTKIEDKLSELDTWKFWLKGCTYTFDLEDKSYTNFDTGILYQDKRTNDVKLCECKAKGHGYVTVRRIEKVKVRKSEFEQQMKTLGNVGNHPNIVPPFGYCFYQCDMFLFYDTYFLEGSNLYSRLHEYMGRRIVNCEFEVIRTAWRKFSSESQLKISLGVARGISHLHSVKCIHGNLHSYNVIINSDLDGCISDYGLLSFSSAAKKSDVHSFGVILLEMLSRTEPLKEHTQICYFGSAEEDLHWWIAKVVSQRIYFKEEHEMLKIAMLCVEKDLDKRPEMDDVVKMIKKIEISVQRIVSGKDEGESSTPKEDESSQEPDEGESSKPKVDEYSEIQSYQDPKKKESVNLFGKMVQELHMGLVNAKDEGESSQRKEDESSQEPDEGESSKPKEDESSQEFEEGESSKPKVDEYSEIQSFQDPEKKESVKLFRKMVQELHMGLVGAKDERESSQSKEDESSQELNEGESSKPKVAEYLEIQSCQNPEEKETVYPAKKLEWITKIEDKLSELDTWKFYLKGCTYTFDLDKSTNDVKFCECKAKGHGYVRVGRIEEVKIGKGEFEQQMETSGRIGSHPNIVRPFGYCFYQSELFLFYESFPKGRNLYKILEKSIMEYPLSSYGDGKLNWRSILKISLGVARGISYLHSVKCIHGNLHSSNVLLNKGDGCISDYGLLNFSSATKKSDVHSFGVILLRMVSNSKPSAVYFGSAEEELHQWIESVVSAQNLFETVFGTLDNEEHGMMKIALLCVEKDLDKRPEMDDVVKMIQKVQTLSLEDCT